MFLSNSLRLRGLLDLPQPVIDIGVAGVVDVSADDEGVANPEESLSKCVYGLLIGNFTDVNVFGVIRNAVSNVWFKSELPFWALGVKAVTLGVRVYYDATALTNLSKPTWDEFETIVEEVAHVDQFLKMWAKLPLKRKRVGVLGTKEVVRPQTYTEAVEVWKSNYVVDAIFHGYSQHPLEVNAKLKVNFVIANVRNISKGKNGPCG